MSNHTPKHLLPNVCYVCGQDAHPPTPLHTFISNAQAKVEIVDRYAAVTHTFPSGTSTPEAHYVATHRPY